MDDIETRINYHLKNALGQNATFRSGQKEALLKLLNEKKTLVVEKTGWGKSLIYFIATKILKEKNLGTTIVFSPLLALMNNQKKLAESFGLKAYFYNVNNKNEWKDIKEKLFNGLVDILFISPERLANNHFQDNVLDNMIENIGMIVIDEAHCISDWGHDFRLDYRRIKSIVKYLPEKSVLLATTATANDRVIEDVSMQLGNDIHVQRGPLQRQSLAIDVIKLNKKEERLAWLIKNFEFFEKAGVIYCLTISDCKSVASWLRKHDINAREYHSKLDNEVRVELETEFINNEIKVLVATTAFGMGIDKPDIGFIIHFQKPGNVVAYYQQIGRAGRAIKNARTVLLAGEEDDNITEYFIDTAFPSQEEIDDVINILEEYESLKIHEISSKLNKKLNRVKNALKHLLIEGYIVKQKKKYYRTTKVWTLDMTYSKEITKTRLYELKKMNEFINTEQCYMKFVTSELNDDTAKNCMKCSNCLEESSYKNDLSKDEIIKGITFLRKQFYSFEPRKQWPPGITKDEKNKIQPHMLNEIGYALSNYNDAGWGVIVKEDKYKNNHFRDELVDASVDLINKKIDLNEVDYITSIPSKKRPNLVFNLAKKIGEKLSVPYYNVLAKTKDNPPQKNFQDSLNQFYNAEQSFEVSSSLSGNYILIDDMVDSSWTLTVCGYKLKENGVEKVYPFVLSNSK